MMVLVKISADGEFCRTGYDQCNFFFRQDSQIARCRAFKEPSESKKCCERLVRLTSNDFGRFERCQQCKDAKVPNNELTGGASAPSSDQRERG